MKRFWILLNILVLLAPILGSSNEDIPVIKPGEYRRDSIINFEQKHFRIRKDDLKPNEKYEVRVSFLGNVSIYSLLLKE
jgi:hypothetical protein